MRSRGAGLAGPWRLAVVLCLLGCSTASAQDHAAHGHPPSAAGDQALCLVCPSARESNGTSWQPDASDAHGHFTTMGPWTTRAHAQAAFLYTDERGPRGGSDVFSLNHAMLGARRQLWGGVVGVQSMWTLEPLIGRSGYPLLAQTGETADGVTPLIDRQHPHDLPMELAATYGRAMADDRGYFLYVAAVGAPALGPPAFMHRTSGARLPIAPITHHWFDSSHVTFGVVTAGFVASPAFKMEVSGFNGREPDQKRWGFERPRLDSFAVRASVNPTPGLAMQLSAAVVHDPEIVHPGANATRFTVSAMYARAWRRVRVDATGAWGQNRRTATSTAVDGGFLVFPGIATRAALVEATVRVDARHALIGRVERADKAELFPLDDPRHNTAFPATRATAAYVFDIARIAPFTLGLGVAGSWVRVGGGIRALYDGPPASVLAFLEMRAH